VISSINLVSDDKKNSANVDAPRELDLSMIQSRSVFFSLSAAAMLTLRDRLAAQEKIRL